MKLTVICCISILERRKQLTLEHLEKQKEAKRLREAEVTRSALKKLLKITVFIVQKKMAHTTNYEDLVRFIGEELEEEVLCEYINFTKLHKNATYLSTSSVTQFINVIGEWIKSKNIAKIRSSEEFTLLLDESADEANRAELSLIARVVDGWEIQNLFIELVQLKECDARSIFDKVEGEFSKNNFDIINVKFAGMDGCSTMSGELNGVQALFKTTSSHLSYIHCRNHRLALCFAHLKGQFPEFLEYDSLLLNLFLVFKNSTVRMSTFSDMQELYGMQSLKLIKAAVTRWLSHGKASQRVIDRFMPLVSALDEIYRKRREPAIKGVRDQLVEPKMIALLCYLTDIIALTNDLQIFLQASRLNFLGIPKKVEALLGKLREKINNPSIPGSNFAKLDELLDALSLERDQLRQTRSFENFDKQTFLDKVAIPMTKALMEEIVVAFRIPEHLAGFSCLDPELMPEEALLQEYGNEHITSLAEFYGEPYRVADSTSPPLVDRDALIDEYQIFKTFVSGKRRKFEADAICDLNMQKIKVQSVEKQLRVQVISKRERIRLTQRDRELKKELEKLESVKVYRFENVFSDWLSNSMDIDCPNMSKVLKLAALIPPSTAEVERSFSLMKLICTPLRKSLKNVNLGHCMRISLHGSLTDEDYEEILDKWLGADDTKSKKRKVACRLEE